ncbi:MAG: NAD(P)/FAD-dependent oxidoreductase [Microbacterium sp.]|uniref:FAD-dependent oxidoreductase n=1 Tax=Microbacterium sp. TaxID=51671 RepID=UPI0039E400B0
MAEHEGAALPASAEVVVVGAGPVGLLLGAELGRRGIDVLLLERRAQAGGGTRAIGIHAPVLAALEASGLTERLLADAVRVPRGEAWAGRRLIGTVRFDRLDVRFPFVATLPQAATEAALALEAPPARRGVEVAAVRRRGEGMLVRTAHGDVASRIVVVAGGAAGRALAYRQDAVRARRYRDRYLMTDADVGDDSPVAAVRLAHGGVLESFPLPHGRRRFVAWDHRPHEDDPASRRERLRETVAAHGLAEAAERITAATGFAVRRAVAPRLRRDRLIVVGDAAHEISPIGGQGMNLGLLDAVTLAPIVAAWVRGGEPREVELRRWERRRVASARIAAVIAAANTAIGRPLPTPADAMRRHALRAALTPLAARLLAHAYAMGFDRDA